MKLSQREQVLSALVIVVLVVGAYGFLRFFPANQKIDSLQKMPAQRKGVYLERVFPINLLKI